MFSIFASLDLYGLARGDGWTLHGSYQRNMYLVLDIFGGVSGVQEWTVFANRRMEFEVLKMYLKREMFQMGDLIWLGLARGV